MVYKAKIKKFDKVSFIVIQFVLLVIPILLLFTRLFYGIWSALIFWSFVIIFVWELIIAWVLIPRAYELTDTDLMIHIGMGSVRIKLDNINRAGIYTFTAVNLFPFGYLGIFNYVGSSLLGYTGLGYRKDLGFLWQYITDRNNIIAIIKKSGRPVLISPDEKDQFLNEFQGKAGIKIESFA